MGEEIANAGAANAQDRVRWRNPVFTAVNIASVISTKFEGKGFRRFDSDPQPTCEPCDGLRHAETSAHSRFVRNGS